jgi:hypothetical protein
MLVTISGTRNGQAWPTKGNPLDLPDDEALALIEQKMAVPDHQPQLGVETATMPTDNVEFRSEPAAPPVPTAQERPLTTKTGPGPGKRSPR